MYDYRIKEDLEFVLDVQNQTIEDFARDAEIDKRIVSEILKGEKNVSKDKPEKIYSTIYDYGIRLNTSKEEIYRETSAGRKLLFHGAKKQIETIKADGSRENCDFGPGFYTGETFSQALSFVSDCRDASVYVFECDFEGLEILKFDCSLEWMLAICCFRNTIKEYNDNSRLIAIKERINKADVIEAPIADNKMFYIMQLFAKGDINDQVALHSLAASGLGKQIVFKTEKAIQKLDCRERLYLCQKEKENNCSEMSDRSNRIDTKLKMSRREFDGKGKYIDELFA